MYIFKEPSLQRMTEMKIVTELWKQEDVKIEIALDIKIQSYYPMDDIPSQDIRPIKNALKNQVIEINILAKVSALPLPKTLKVNLLNLVRPLGSEIKKWWCYHNDLELTIPKKLCWTPHGAVHYKKTAELIVRDESVDIETRYAIACMYCFEDDVRILWKQIAEERKERFYYFEEDLIIWPWISRDLRDYRLHMVAFWTYTVNNKLPELHEMVLKTFSFEYRTSVYEFIFEWAIHGLNQSAVEFIFKKLSCKEKEEMKLIVYTRNVLRSSLFHSCKMETAFFLLKQMCQEQQETFFRLKTFKVLENMLHWPCQTPFLEITKKYFHYLHIYDSSELFYLICDKIKRDKKDYDYEELFLKLWHIASVNNQGFFLTYYTLSIILKLFEAKKDLIKYVLNKATDVQKEQLLYITCYDQENSSPVIINKNRCLKFLMSEVITCNETIIYFKEYVESLHSRERDAKSIVKLTKALEIVQDTILKRK